MVAGRELTITGWPHVTGNFMDDNPQAKKSLGQHWLRDEASLQAMCQSGNIKSSDTVLEIGPGLGTLTELLVNQSKNVIAVEFDKDLAISLPKKVKADNLEVFNEDILQFDLSKMPKDYKLVANIPYYLTSNLIRRISESSNPPIIAVLLVQKEVARRVVAEPGDMSLLSITAQYYWETSLGLEVPAELFDPAPKVDSQIVILKRRSEKLYDDVEPKELFRIVKAGFSQRRKTLLNSLSAGMQIDKNIATQVLAEAGIEPSRRPQTLSLDDWRNLYIALKT